MSHDQRAALIYLLQCQSRFFLTQHGLCVFHTICSVTQTTGPEINTIFSTSLGLPLILNITYLCGKK